MIGESEEKFAVTSEIARNFGQSFKYERGIEVANTILDPFHQVEGYIRVVKNLIKNKQHDKALELLEKSEAIALEIKESYKRAIVIRKIISELISLKSNEKALILLNALEKQISEQ
ncbi:hypothetical protein [Caldalkalibacillus mannanilyticus]|uniref:hypothetical protein n=1 Tax=Caldalkalibacillus mannanilyticus TaxID=1418 RepID=UPI000685F1E3|nr:hypothetical protein [Caldalkalibacillus mannanilyticus]